MGAALSRPPTKALLGLCVAAAIYARHVFNGGKKRLTAPNTKGPASVDKRGASSKVITAGVPPPPPSRAPPPLPSCALPPPPSRLPPPLPASHLSAASRASSLPAVDAQILSTKEVACSPLDIDVWICLDFEWTCDEGEHRQVRSDEGEIIEFSFAVYDARAGNVPCEGQYYCKNEQTPITQFCTELTQITQEQLDNAGSLKDALDALERDLANNGFAGRSCCAVAHGSADLELMLPRNCKAHGLEVPPVLRRYVDLREAAQTYVASTGTRGVRASTLKQICEALEVEMIGAEHCGLDDSWMVLRATQELLKVGAKLRPVDLDAERVAFLNASNGEKSLCLDGLPFFTILTDIQHWFKVHTQYVLPDDAVSIVLGMDGRPSGRAVLTFDSHETAAQALKSLDGGRRLVCNNDETFLERLVLARPLRHQEQILQKRTMVSDTTMGPILAPFPADAEAIQALRFGGKGKGKGKSRPRPTAASGCEGRVKLFYEEKGFGFITYWEGDVFVHRNDCHGTLPKEGDLISFDVVEDPRNGKMKAVNAQVVALSPGDGEDGGIVEDA